MLEGQYNLLKTLRWHTRRLISGEDHPWPDGPPIDLERIDFLADDILTYSRRWADVEYNSEDTNALFDSLILAGRSKLINSEFTHAERIYREGLELSLNTKFDLNPLAVAKLKQNLGAALDLQGREDESLHYSLEALDAMECMDPVPTESVANLSNNLGLIYRNRKDFEKAEEHYLRAKEIFEANEDSQLNLALVSNNLGTLYWAVDELDAAKVSHEKALGIRSEHLPPNSPDIAQSASNLAVVFHQNHQLEKAEALYKMAVKILNKTITEDPDLYDAVTQNYGALLELMGDPRQSAKILAKAGRKLREIGHEPDVAA